jgi:hypothetical protein
MPFVWFSEPPGNSQEEDIMPGQDHLHTVREIFAAGMHMMSRRSSSGWT